jgi:hypothetical protein
MMHNLRGVALKAGTGGLAAMRMTTTRRAFLRATAVGVASAALPARAQPASPASPIHFHAHWIGPHVVELLGKRTSPRPPQGHGWFDIDARLRQMNRPVCSGKSFRTSARRTTASCRRTKRAVYLDTGQSDRGPRGIALAAKVFGADRILFGTGSGPTSLVA